MYSSATTRPECRMKMNRRGNRSVDSPGITDSSTAGTCRYARCTLAKRALAVRPDALVWLGAAAAESGTPVRIATAAHAAASFLADPGVLVVMNVRTIL